MAIDYQDYQRFLKTAPGSDLNPITHPVQVQYRTVELSAAWTLLQDWLRVGIEAKEKELASYMEAFQKSPDYRHDALVKHKVSIDNLIICQ
jgi:hypothetical protein